MVWAAICKAGKASLAIITETMNAEKYVRVLEDYLITFKLSVHDYSAILVQDN